MDGNAHKLELLWKRLEDAKLQLDHCHNRIKEITRDTAAGALSTSDGNLARRHALKAEELAINAYVSALNDFKVALRWETSLDSPSNAAGEAGDANLFGITLREREVLALVASGKSSREIAQQFGIAFRTVATHRYRLLRKMNVRNTADLTRIAIRMGLTKP